jgi:plasmid replication initiation protein
MRRSGDLAKRVAAIAEKAKSQEPHPDKKPPVFERTRSASRPKSLLPARYQNRDFFICDLFDYALKDDGASMEAPIFTLSTKRDLSIWEWTSQDGSKYIKVYPSVLGRATQFDKDVLIYVISQMTQALNECRPDAKNRTVRFRVHDYLVATNRHTSGREYRNLRLAFERLKGTNITTDIRTGGQRITEGFGIIDKWKIVEKSPVDERMIAIEVTLSDWLYNAVQAQEVLTIHRDYFRLRKPLERRLYELSRKHCGKQVIWKIGLALLQEKCGSKSGMRRFRQAVRQIMADETIPDYRLKLDATTDQVIIFKRK